MGRTVHIIHGIHTSEPDKSVGRIARFFDAAGHRAIVHEYGHIWAWEARFRNPGIARDIGAHVQPGDILVGHSNGCDIIRRIIATGRWPLGAILINPALDRDTQFGAVGWIHVYHNQADSAVALSRLLLWHPWGAMGRDGYTGNDPRVTNIDCYPSVQGHSTIFRPEAISVWGPRIVRTMEVELSAEAERLRGVA